MAAAGVTDGTIVAAAGVTDRTFATAAGVTSVGVVSAPAEVTAMSHRAAVVAAQASAPVRTTAAIVAGSEEVAPVSAAIAYVDVGTMVEEVAIGVVAIDGEGPYTAVPEQRVEEIVGGCEDGVLPVEEYVAQVGVAIAQVSAIDIVGSLHAHQVVEIDLVAVLILLVVEVELVGHLVGEEESLLAGLFVAHGCCRKDAAENHCE